MADRLFLLGQRLSVMLALLILLVPVGAGLIWMILPALGWLPAIGATEFSLAPLWQMAAAPGFARATVLAVFTGLTATLLSLVLASLAVAFLQARPGFSWLERQLSPLLSVPHITIAIGVSFLLTPSGWVMRLLSPWLTGYQRPPDLLTMQDPAGLSLILVLVLKEMPFLMLMILSVLPQIDGKARLQLAQSLGYRPLMAWYKIVWPALYGRIRLAIFITLAFSMSVVDIALIVGPVTPPTLSILVLQWFQDANINLRLQAAAGALWLTLICMGAIAAWIAAERAAGMIATIWRRHGHRGGLFDMVATGQGFVAIATVLTLAWGGLLALAIWSVARQWRFPDPLPGRYTLDSWMRVPDRVMEPLGNTVLIAVLAVCISAVIGCLLLERERTRHGRVRQRLGLALMVPLLLPQIGFLFGFQIFLAWLDLAGGWFALIWAHILFVLPYMYLSMADAWTRFDERYMAVATNLGAGPWRSFWRIKLPILLKPLMTAMAVGIAVSVAAYLPTLVAGLGRIDSLTTDVVSLAASGNRRLAGVYGMLQMVIPVLAFAAIPLVMRWRKVGS